MSVLLRIGKNKAILRGGEWLCASTQLEEELNRFTRRWVQRDAHTTQLQGNLEDRIAEAVAQRFGGRIGLRLDPQGRRHDRHYLKLRQLNLFDTWNS